MFVAPVRSQGILRQVRPIAPLPSTTSSGKSSTRLRMRQIREVAKAMEEPPLAIDLWPEGALVLSLATRNLGFRFAQEMS
jgi:hypothetical protein